MTRIVLLDKEDFGYSDFQSKPLGGAQTALIELVTAFAHLGCMVSVRNRTIKFYAEGLIDWQNIESAEIPDGDLYIVSRAVDLLALVPPRKPKLLWLHNHAKYLLRPKTLFQLIRYRPLLVFSGSYHRSTFPLRMFFQSKIIPLGVSKVFFDVAGLRKAPGPKVIFTSNPLRSLRWLIDKWIEIRKRVPAAELHIFAGPVVYGSWGEAVRPAMQEVLNYAREKERFGIFLREPVGKLELAQELFNCRAMFYRGDPAETFCLSIAEAQAMGVPCVVQDYGSMRERVKHLETGFICNNDDDFISGCIKILNDDDAWLSFHVKLLQARNIWSWDRVAKSFVDVAYELL